MSVTTTRQLPGPLAGLPLRRVRDHVRDGVAVVVFSAVASTGLTLGLMMLARLVD